MCALSARVAARGRARRALAASGREAAENTVSPSACRRAEIGQRGLSGRAKRRRRCFCSGPPGAQDARNTAQGTQKPPLSDATNDRTRNRPTLRTIGQRLWLPFGCPLAALWPPPQVCEVAIPTALGRTKLKRNFRCFIKKIARQKNAGFRGRRISQAVRWRVPLICLTSQGQAGLGGGNCK